MVKYIKQEIKSYFFFQKKKTNEKDFEKTQQQNDWII